MECGVRAGYIFCIFLYILPLLTQLKIISLFLEKRYCTVFNFQQPKIKLELQRTNLKAPTTKAPLFARQFGSNCTRRSDVDEFLMVSRCFKMVLMVFFYVF